MGHLSAPAPCSMVLNRATAISGTKPTAQSAPSQTLRLTLGCRDLTIELRDALSPLRTPVLHCLSNCLIFSPRGDQKRLAQLLLRSLVLAMKGVAEMNRKLQGRHINHRPQSQHWPGNVPTQRPCGFCHAGIEARHQGNATKPALDLASRLTAPTAS